jgi:hypothetical protein
MVCRVFPGVGHLGEQESWGRRSAGRAGAGADEGFCCTVCGAAEGPPRRSKENTRSPPGRGVSGLTDTASENVAPARACAVGCLVSAVVAGSSLSRERRPSFATPTECEGHRWSLALWSSLRSRTAYALCGDLDSPPRLLMPRVTT